MGRLLSESQRRDLRDIADGLVRGESARTCESLCRLRYLRGDWLTGYYVTRAGARILDAGEEVGRG